jgi:hypothetical protein
VLVCGKKGEEKEDRGRREEERRQLTFTFNV